MSQRVLKFRAWHPTFHRMFFDVVVTSDGWKENMTPSYWGPLQDVMQCTGLHDRKGREIYEGDLVRVWEYEPVEGEEAEEPLGDSSVHEVRWGGADSYPAFELYPHLDCDSNALQFYAAIQPDHQCLEIIGNRCEQPELLTKKSQP